jgi:hypothetical protein
LTSRTIVGNVTIWHCLTGSHGLVSEVPTLDPGVSVGITDVQTLTTAQLFVVRRVRFRPDLS